MTSVADEYDVFLSYARGDTALEAVTRLAEDIRTIFAQRTRRQLRVFIDQQEISTAQPWRERISSALHASAILIAVVTEGYLESEWCRNEWDYFTAQERGLAGDGDQPRIFPVFLRGEPTSVAAPPVIQKWMRAIKLRQCADLGDRDRDSDIFHEKISRLTDDIIAALGQERQSGLAIVSDRDMEHHYMFTGYVKEGKHFVGLLAKAVNVTIVGMTNEGLATMLQKALDSKRERSNDPDSFWGSLRIVFLSDKLLNWLNDEKSEYPDPHFELAQRELASGYGRRSIEGFLKRSSSTRWELFESSYFPPFSGALLEMPDGSRIIQLIIRRPQRRTLDHLFMEFEDPTDQYFTAAFEDVVHNSSEVNRVVPVGLPRDGDFLCTSARFFQNVLVDGSGQASWMPLVLVVTWWKRNGHAEPVLQIRTDANSSRELERLSHLAGYVYLDPYPGSAAQPVDRPAEFQLPTELIDLTARNRVRMETGSPPFGELNLVTTREYLHPDKEHLFFYVYEFQLPDHFQFPQRAQMCHVSVEKLLEVRKNQTLRNAIELCRSADKLPLSKYVAFEIVALNLTLHDLANIGEELRQMANASEPDFRQLLSELRSLEKKTRVPQRSGTVEVELRGLSGLQYREFFTMLIPLYVKLGISGAAGILETLHQSEVMKEALDRLAVLYHDEDIMMNIPVEL